MNMFHTASEQTDAETPNGNMSHEEGCRRAEAPEIRTGNDREKWPEAKSKRRRTIQNLQTKKEEHERTVDNYKRVSLKIENNHTLS